MIWYLGICIPYTLFNTVNVVFCTLKKVSRMRTQHACRNLMEKEPIKMPNSFVLMMPEDGVSWWQSIYGASIRSYCARCEFCSLALQVFGAGLFLASLSIARAQQHSWPLPSVPAAPLCLISQRGPQTVSWHHKISPQRQDWHQLGTTGLTTNQNSKKYDSFNWPFPVALRQPSFHV